LSAKPIGIVVEDEIIPRSKSVEDLEERLRRLVERRGAPLLPPRLVRREGDWEIWRFVVGIEGIKGWDPYGYEIYYERGELVGVLRRWFPPRAWEEAGNWWRSRR